jgi:transcriptional regulator with XRE-family HTH domain
LVRLARSAEGLQNPIYKVVGNNIEKFRTVRGLSQDDLALITGYNRSSIRKMEKGKQRIHLDTVALLAQSLDVPFYVFFTDSNAEVRYWKGEYIRIETKYQTLKKKTNEFRKLLNEQTSHSK